MSGKSSFPEPHEKGAVGGRPTPSPIVNQYYNIHDVPVVQIGPNSRAVFEEGTELLRREGKQGGFGKTEVLVAMINSILNPDCVLNPPEKTLEEVEETFRRHHSAATGNSEKSSFKDVYGLPLRSFFDRHCDLYDVFTVNNVCKVRIKKAHKKKKKKKTKGKVETNEVTHQKDISSSSQAELAAAVQGEDDTDLSPTSWTVVKHRETRMERLKAEEKAKETKTVHRFHSDEDTEVLVRHLLTKPEGDDLIFHVDDSVYKDHPGKLTQDIMCQWNTPYLVRPHIVLGVQTNPQPPHILVGLRTRERDDLYQSLFQRDRFVIPPQFEYKDCVIDGKIIGVIEVRVSLAKGYPAIPKRDDEEANYKAEEMWLRSGRDNTVCRPSDPRTALVYQRFLGSPGSAESEEKPIPTLQQKRRVREAEERKEEGSKTRSAIEDEFLQATQNFRRGHFSLIVGKTQLTPRQMKAIALGPWISVLDFDPCSRDNGLLCHINDEISARRYPHLFTWMEKTSSLTDNGVQWIFLQGMRENPDSLTPHDMSQWQRQTESAVRNICRQHANFVEIYTVLTVVVLWPQDPTTARCIAKFVIELFKMITNPPPKVVVCCCEEPDDEKARRSLHVLLDDYEDQLSWVKISHEQVCSAMREAIKDDSNETRASFYLPAACDDRCKVSEKDRGWLKEDLEVLYNENPYSKKITDVDALREEQDDFFRGGTLHWFAWYGVSAGHLDVERDIMEHVIRFIEENHLIKNKGGVVKLLHAPGAGGSTLAQRVLWELHGKAPCAQVKQRQGSSVEDLVDRILFLQSETRLPVILLLDGIDEARLNQLYLPLARHSVVFLKVRRYPYRIQKPYFRETEGAFYLTGTVSPREAARLALKFSDRCRDDEDKRKKLRDLSKDVESGKSHYLYEFGMTVYLQEFRGVKAHVQGYLRLAENPTPELLSWQRALGFLALVHYYSQSSLPMQYLAPLLHQPSNFAMEIQDFPHPMEEFIVPDRQENREKYIRICHYIVSKEILKQLLNRTGHRSVDRDRLSREARRNLLRLCLDLIRQTTSRKIPSALKSDALQFILTETFIVRDDRDIGEVDDSTKRRVQFAQVMVDIDEEAPYSGREEVLIKLTEAFPNNPNFPAHLGRFYSICRPELGKKAEQCLNKALEICKELEAQKGKDDNLRRSLMHIHHIYGVILQSRNYKYTGKNTAATEPVTPENFPDVAEEVLANARLACENFQESRENAPRGQEKSYGYLSEIKVRLQVCDFFARHTEGGIRALLYGSKSPGISRFVRESCSAIDDLILECWKCVDVKNIVNTFQKHSKWFCQLFKGRVDTVNPSSQDNDVASWRMTITAIKLKYSCFKKGGSITSCEFAKEDLNSIVFKYERIFALCQDSEQISKRSLEIYYREWVEAIRSPLMEKVYELEEVLSHVKHWYEVVRSPTSKFYVFVLLSLLGFGTKGRRGNSESLLEALDCQKEVERMSKTVLRPRRTREWLGPLDSEGIRVLVPGSRVGLIGHSHDQEREDTTYLLGICKGSILPPNNNRLAGHIILDLGNNTIPVHVFYIPLKAGLDGPRHAHKRVEFWMAFTMEHGYEAFSVCELCKYTCTKCDGKMEITSEENFVYCNCGAVVEKTTEAETVEKL